MKKRVVLYIFCIILGCAVGSFFINLPQAVQDKPVVAVDVHSEPPVIIHDTVTKVVLKNRYIYRSRCCSRKCNTDSI